MTDLMVACTCGEEFLSELSRWRRWYVQGESWHETCPGCGTDWWVDLKARRSRNRLPHCIADDSQKRP